MGKHRGVTVGELVQALSRLDQTALVICQADPEGNGFSPLHEVSIGAKYRPGKHIMACGEMVFEEQDFRKGDRDCVILIPS